MIQQQPIADLILTSWPTAIHSAQAAFVEVTVRNRTSEAWDPEGPYAVYASYHWVDEQGEWLPHDGLRTNLPRTVAPGEQLQVALRIHPPLVPSRYRLVLDLVRLNDGWLNLNQIVSVEVRQATGRRATLVINSLAPGETISNSVMHKLRVLHTCGYTALILTNKIDARLPLDDQAYMVEAPPELVLDPDPNHAWVAEHFGQSSIYLFEYTGYYPLVELITAAPNSPTILDCHTVMGNEPAESTPYAHEPMQGIDGIHLVAYADYAVAHTEHIRRRLIDTGLIDPDRVIVMPYGAPLSRMYGRTPGEAPAELRGCDGPVLLHVRGTPGNERIDMLIKMAARVRKEFPTVRLVLVADDRFSADGATAEATRKLMADLGIQENVIFTEPKAQDELPAYYDASDVYVTSRMHEGFSVPIVEAMAFRKPVVAPAEATLSATVGDAGLLFEPENVEQFAEYVLVLLRSQRSARGSFTHAANGK